MAAKEKDPLFEVKDLIAAAPAAFKVNPEVMVGALHGVDKPITKAEAVKKLEAFLTKPIGGK